LSSYFPRKSIAHIKKIFTAATRNGRNDNGKFAHYWKRRFAVAFKAATIRQAHNALRHYEKPFFSMVAPLPEDPDLSDFDDEMNDF